MRRRSAFMAAVGVLLASLAVVPPTAGEPHLGGFVRALGPSAAESGDPVRRLGACAASGAPTDVLLVLDRSASLKDTDPDDTRVDAAQYFLKRLAEFAEDSGA